MVGTSNQSVPEMAIDVVLGGPIGRRKHSFSLPVSDRCRHSCDTWKRPSSSVLRESSAVDDEWWIWLVNDAGWMSMVIWLVIWNMAGL